MRIMLVLGFHNPFPGAGWQRIGFLGEKWSTQGHHIDIVGAMIPNSLMRGKEALTSKAIILNLLPSISTRAKIPGVFALNLFLSFWFSIIVVSMRHPEVVVVSLPEGDVGLGVILACTLLGKRFIVDYRDEWEDYCIHSNRSFSQLFFRICKRIATALYKRAMLIVTVTNPLKKFLERRGVYPVKVIPNGADTRIWKPAYARKNGFVLIYIGVIGGYYPLDSVVIALKKVITQGASDARLKIVGEGDIKRVLQSAERLGIIGSVEYLGSVRDQNRLVEILQRTDIGIIPFDTNPLWNHALPAKFYEYCACGLPVLATVGPDSLLAEVIRDHKIGIICRPNDSESLSGAILHYYRHPNKLYEAGERARILVERHFDRARLADKYLDLLIQTLEGQLRNV